MPLGVSVQNKGRWVASEVARRLVEGQPWPNPPKISWCLPAAAAEVIGPRDTHGTGSGNFFCHSANHHPNHPQKQKPMKCGAGFKRADQDICMSPEQGTPRATAPVEPMFLM